MGAITAEEMIERYRERERGRDKRQQKQRWHEKKDEFSPSPLEARRAPLQANVARDIK